MKANHLVAKWVVLSAVGMVGQLALQLVPLMAEKKAVLMAALMAPMLVLHSASEKAVPMAVV